MEELRQSPEWGKYLAELGWETETVAGCRVRLRQIGRLGSILKIQRPESLPLQQIDVLAKNRRALFTKVEPLTDDQLRRLSESGYSPDTWPLNPSRTVFLNLARSEEEILYQTSKDTRQSIKKALTLGLSAIVYNQESKDFGHALEIFYDLFRQTGREKKFWIPPLKDLSAKARAFGRLCYLILVFRVDQKLLTATDLLPLAGAFLLIHDGIGYYHHAASLELGQLVRAPYLCLWETIKTAKAEGCQILDLEGIFDLRFPSMGKRWVDFSTFKLKWGGEIVAYPPPTLKTFNPLLRLFFRLAK